MPDQAKHLQAAKENEGLALSLVSQEQGLSWVAVISFYAALHLVDACLATQGIHPRTHVIRRSYLQREPELRALVEDYRELELRSREARYELVVFTTEEANHLLQGPLARIRNSVETLLRIP